MVHNHTYIDLLDDAQLLYAVEWITFLVALALTCTIIPVAHHLYKSGHTHEFPFWIYAVNFINAYGLCLYSSLSDCTIMIALNIFAMLVYGASMLIFIGVSKNRLWPLLKLAAMLVSSYYIRHHVTYVAPPEQHEDFLGSVTMTTTAITLLPPLLHVNHFRRQQSCHGMPVAMSVFGFISCICWTVYGKLLEDPYTYLPNITGFIGSATYLALGIMYGFPQTHHHDHHEHHEHDKNATSIKDSAKMDKNQGKTETTGKTKEE